MKSRTSALLLLMGVIFLGGCTVTPDAEELPEDESLVKTEPAEPVTAPEAAEEPLIPVTRLTVKGVRGGKISFDVEGTPDAIATKLLDFKQSADHRSWVKKFEPLEGKGKMSRARWHFEGKAGINPVVELGFWLQGDADKRVIRYRLVKEDFGLGAFFGDISITRKSDSPPVSTITERTFIDSGVWIANASHEEIDEGLREDARLLKAYFAGTLSELLEADRKKEEG